MKSCDNNVGYYSIYIYFILSIVSETVIGFQYLVVSAARAKAEDKQVTMRVSASKVLPIWRTLTVKDRTVALTLDLHTNTHQSRETQSVRHNKHQ